MSKKSRRARHGGGAQRLDYDQTVSGTVSDWSIWEIPAKSTNLAILLSIRDLISASSAAHCSFWAASAYYDLEQAIASEIPPARLQHKVRMLGPLCDACLAEWRAARETTSPAHPPETSLPDTRSRAIRVNATT